MKLTRKIAALILSLSLSVALLTGMTSSAYGNDNKVKAESVVQTSSITVLETDAETASEGCTMLGVYGSYYSQAQEALDRINAIRKEACDAGNVPDPGNPSRMLASGDYVPIQWSKDLESIARIRAMEGGMAYGFLSSGHSRLNGKDIWSVQYNGVRSYAEDLAYNWGNSMVSGINQWYEEKNDWVNQTKGAVTGHYTSMIDPKHAYVGLGDFYTKEAQYPNTLAAAFCFNSENLDQSMQPAQANIMQKVEVMNSYIRGYSLDGESTIDIGGTTELALRADLINGSNTLRLWVLEPVVYTSSDTSIAQVTDNGVVTGRKSGTASITVKSGTDELASISITVKTPADTDNTNETGNGNSSGTDTDNKDKTDNDNGNGTDTDNKDKTDNDNGNRTDSGNGNETDNGNDNGTDTIKTGTRVTDKNSKTLYKVTGTGDYKSVEYIKSTKESSANVIIPDSIIINGSKYKVTSIGKNAFKGSKKLKSVTIGKNITSIDEKAFSDCKKLRNITVKSTKLTASNIGKNAFSKGYSKPKVKAKKSKCKLYKSIFISRGMSKKCRFTAL